MVCRACFVIAPRMTNSGLVPLIVELDLPFHSSVKKTSIGQCGGAYLEWGSLFPNEPRTYVKVTKHLLAQSARKTKPRIVLRLLPNLWEHSLMVGLAVCVPKILCLTQKCLRLGALSLEKTNIRIHLKSTSVFQWVLNPPKLFFFFIHIKVLVESF